MEKSNLVKNDFYTAPPYNYRPSIAEYLTTFNVTKNSFIADILHLDHKKNLKINFEKDFIRVKLLNKKDLDTTEIIIWDYLKSLEKNNEIKLSIDKIPKRIINKFYAAVAYKTLNKFGTKLVKNQTWPPESSIAPIVASRILVGFVFLMINGFCGFAWMLTLIIGLIKMSKEKTEVRFFLSKFILKYILITGGYILVLVLSVLSLLYLSTKVNEFYLFIFFAILMVVFFFIFFYQYSKIIYDYLCWIIESKEASENRIKWLEFKKFVIDNSEIEKRPLAHYVLWGPFYYYTLAVGGIKNLKIR